MVRYAILGLLVVAVAAPSATAQIVNDPSFQVETVVSGLDLPSTMAFIGTDDILVLQKNDGRVRRVIGGVLQPGEVLDVVVDPYSDHGLLGIVTDPDFVNNGFVYIFYSETLVEGDFDIAERVYRYTWNGSALVSPKLVHDLPAAGFSQRIGGILVFGADDLLYTVTGDYQRRGKLQNRALGPDPDNTSVILRTYSDGSTALGGPLSGTGSLAPMNRYYAYGIRNSFGLAIDPVTGALWDTENGEAALDEINRVVPGLDSGWFQIQGPDAISAGDLDDLWYATGAVYSDPEFSWYRPVGVTSLGFVANPKLGCGRVHDLLVGDSNCGNLYHFVPNAARDGLAFTSPELQDLVADNLPDDEVCTLEQGEVLFGSEFGVITDIETGPDGLVYLVSLTGGAIYRIVPTLPVGSDADADGVEDSCDCNAADAGAWTATDEVPRIRVSGVSPTALGWDSQAAASGTATTYSVVTGRLKQLRASRTFGAACTLGSGLAATRLSDSHAQPLPGDGYYYLVRASNTCGAGTFGDSSIVPDPRDAIDTTLPVACN